MWLYSIICERRARVILDNFLISETRLSDFFNYIRMSVISCAMRKPQTPDHLDYVPALCKPVYPFPSLSIY
jgi:hypothetical protein